MKLQNTPLLETKRLVLRKFTQDDLCALFAIFSDKDVNTYLPWFPLNSIEEAKEFFQQRYACVYGQARGYQYAICLKHDDTPIGYVNVSMDDGHDFGYGLCKNHWYKGIVTEAGNAVIEQLRRDGLPYLTATHDINNCRSGSVMKRLGMEYQYSYEEQWQPKNLRVIFRMYQLNLDDKKDRQFKKYWDNSAVRFVEERELL